MGVTPTFTEPGNDRVKKGIKKYCKPDIKETEFVPLLENYTLENFLDVEEVKTILKKQNEALQMYKNQQQTGAKQEEKDNEDKGTFPKEDQKKDASLQPQNPTSIGIQKNPSSEANTNSKPIDPMFENNDASKQSNFNFDPSIGDLTNHSFSNIESTFSPDTKLKQDGSVSRTMHPIFTGIQNIQSNPTSTFNAEGKENDDFKFETFGSRSPERSVMDNVSELSASSYSHTSKKRKTNHESSTRTTNSPTGGMEEVNTDPLGTNNSPSKKRDLSNYKNETDNPKNRNDDDASKPKKPKTVTDNPSKSFDMSGEQSDGEENHDKDSICPDESGKHSNIEPSANADDTDKDPGKDSSGDVDKDDNVGEFLDADDKASKSADERDKLGDINPSKDDGPKDASTNPVRSRGKNLAEFLKKMKPDSNDDSTTSGEKLFDDSDDETDSEESKETHSEASKATILENIFQKNLEWNNCKYIFEGLINNKEYGVQASVKDLSKATYCRKEPGILKRLTEDGMKPQKKTLQTCVFQGKRFG